ncbi:MAG: hypothetical protein ACRDC6_06190 [Shewanella sp.]
MAEQGRRIGPHQLAPAPGQGASKSLTQAVHSGGMASKEKPRSGASCFYPLPLYPLTLFLTNGSTRPICTPDQSLLTN